MVNVAVPPPSVVVRPEVGITVIPTVSLSVFVTATSAAFIALKIASEVESADVGSGWIMIPSTTKSSAPVTVTVCAVFQFAEVNVSDAGATVPSVDRMGDRQGDTLALGGRRIIKENGAVPPPSVVVRPEVGATVMPAVSSSVLVTATSEAFIPL